MATGSNGSSAAPATRVLIGTLLYYAVLAFAGIVVLRYLPRTRMITATSLDALFGAATETVRAGNRVVAAPVDQGTLAATEMLAMLSAALLALPVAWIYTLTRARRGYQQSVVQLLLVLPVGADGKLGPFHSVVASAEGSGFETRDVESLREHYALTLREWIKRLGSCEAEAIGLVGQHAYRVWRLYMTAAEYGFTHGRLNVLQTLLAKPRDGDAMLPLTRADLYAKTGVKDGSGTFARSAR